jgi:hypothetical protein
VTISRDDMPARIAKLPTDARGYPVPRFVATVDGKPDFRVVDNSHWLRCAKHRRCWICGDTLGRHVAFVCGPSSAVTGVTSEPGSHVDCAQYAIRTCPFILFPQRRRDPDTPGVRSESTIQIDRNPGVWALWVTSEYKPFQIGDTAMIQLGKPSRLDWFRRAEPASVADIAEGIKSAMCQLPPRAFADGTADMFRKYLLTLKGAA